MKLERVLLSFSTLLLVFTLVGCGNSFGRTAEERLHMYKTITRAELKMAKDDFDNFMMADRRSRLTRWH